MKINRYYLEINSNKIVNISNFIKKKRAGRKEYLRARINNNGMIDVFKSEGSGRISGLSWSTGLVELPEESLEINKGDSVNFIPYSNYGI